MWRATPLAREGSARKGEGSTPMTRPNSARTSRLPPDPQPISLIVFRSVDVAGDASCPRALCQNGGRLNTNDTAELRKDVEIASRPTADIHNCLPICRCGGRRLLPESALPERWKAQHQ